MAEEEAEAVAEAEAEVAAEAAAGVTGKVASIDLHSESARVACAESARLWGLLAPTVLSSISSTARDELCRSLCRIVSSAAPRSCVHASGWRAAGRQWVWGVRSLLEAMPATALGGSGAGGGGVGAAGEAEEETEEMEDPMDELLTALSDGAWVDEGTMWPAAALTLSWLRTTELHVAFPPSALDAAALGRRRRLGPPETVLLQLLVQFHSGRASAVVSGTLQADLHAFVSAQLLPYLASISAASEAWEDGGLLERLLSASLRRAFTEAGAHGSASLGACTTLLRCALPWALHRLSEPYGCCMLVLTTTPPPLPPSPQVRAASPHRAVPAASRRVLAPRPLRPRDGPRRRPAPRCRGRALGRNHARAYGRAERRRG